jgi:hypothetical protein
MPRHSSRIPTFAILLFASILVCGCAGPWSPPKLAHWPFGKKQEAVPGITPPAERIAKIRKMGKKAAWAKPEEQRRTSRELAAAFEVEEDPVIRLEIVSAIGEYRTPEAESVLAAAMDDSEPEIRMIACRAWGERGGAEAAAKLTEALRTDLDEDVRLTAALALGKTGDRAALAGLGEALDDRDPAMQYQAVRSLQAITGEDLGNDVNQWRRYVRGEPLAESEPISIAERVGGLFH